MEQIVNDLIKYFLNEKNAPVIDIPENYIHKREFLRGLINVREAKPIDESILNKESELLKLELEDKNVVDINTFEDKFNIWQGDITLIKCDAIVNPASHDLLGCFKANHNCIDNKVHTYAGIGLRLKCKEIIRGDKVETCKVILTDGFNLPCDKIIHTVRPNLDENLGEKEKEEIEKFYVNSLDLAKKNNIKTICLPNLSTNEPSFKQEIRDITLNVIKDYLKEDNFFEKVVLNVFTLEEYNLFIEE